MFKKTIYFFGKDWGTPVYSIIFGIFLDFLKIQVFDHFLNFLDFCVSWPVAGNYFLNVEWLPMLSGCL